MRVIISYAIQLFFVRPVRLKQLMTPAGILPRPPGRTLKAKGFPRLDGLLSRFSVLNFIQL